MTEMIKIDRSLKHKHGSGGFGIEILWPGTTENSGDSGVGAIGRIDHAYIKPGTVIAMHPHRDDEILTYVRAGKMLHLDTVGNTEEVSNTRLMLMNAGHTFQHEERVIGDTDAMQCLQIFVRPSEPDLAPQVQFHDFSSAFSDNSWRLIAGPSFAPLVFRAQAWLHDARLHKGNRLALPAIPIPGVARLLYVFQGSATLGNQRLKNGESVLIRDDKEYDVDADEDTDLVLFTTDPAAAVFSGGMFSGNVLSR
ncbi:pirin family protein [Klebsiella quasipneumoniae]|uniref:pirin family protein n=1 Tax=Klebsiella quasipneumoniae TaxID=1463165 RepID=UPI001D185C68|nr:pirin family protein [Klebsiella quasipneumoniae]